LMAETHAELTCKEREGVSSVMVAAARKKLTSKRSGLSVGEKARQLLMNTTSRLNVQLRTLE